MSGEDEPLIESVESAPKLKVVYVDDSEGMLKSMKRSVASFVQAKNIDFQTFQPRDDQATDRAFLLQSYVDYLLGQIPWINNPNSHPDVIILDYNLVTGITGLDIAQKLNESGYAGKIIAMSGEEDNNLKCMASDLFVVSFIKMESRKLIEYLLDLSQTKTIPRENEE